MNERKGEKTMTLKERKKIAKEARSLIDVNSYGFNVDRVQCFMSSVNAVTSSFNINLTDNEFHGIVNDMVRGDL